MRNLVESIKTLAFDIRTIKWMSHRAKDSDYDNGWNDALDKVGEELHLSLEDIGLCETCIHYEVRPNVPDWNICNKHADYRSSDEYCSDHERRKKDGS